MNEKMIENLQRALDDIMNMSEEELFSDFGASESKYYFAELALAEDFFYGRSEPELWRNPADKPVSYKISSQAELEVYGESVAIFQDVKYLWAA